MYVCKFHKEKYNYKDEKLEKRIIMIIESWWIHFGGRRTDRQSERVKPIVILICPQSTHIQWTYVRKYGRT